MCTGAAESPFTTVKDTLGAQILCVFEKGDVQGSVNSKEAFHLRLKVAEKECCEGRITFRAAGTPKISVLCLIRRHFDQVSAA